MDINLAKRELEKLKDSPKYESMLKVAEIVTILLEKHNIKPIKWSYQLNNNLP